MTVPVHDMDLRRALYGQDRGTIVDNVIDGAESLHALVSGWHLTALRESHVVGAEHSLVALQTMLIALRQHVPVSGAART
jgi:hypothetical protein